MSKKSNKPGSASQVQDGAGAGGNGADSMESLAKVREILVGAQMRDHSSRVDELESRLNESLVAMRNDLSTRISAVETAMKSEIEQAATRLEKERAERLASGTAIGDRLGETKRELEAMLGDRAATLQEELDKTADALGKRLQQAVSELGHAKTDRRSLAEMLHGIAQRLESDDRS